MKSASAFTICPTYGMNGASSQTGLRIPRAAPWLTTEEAVSLLCCGVGIAALACSVTLNITFYANLGRTQPEAIVLGCMAGVVDIGKGILPIVIMSFGIRGTAGRRAAGWLAFLAFTLASFMATLGFFAVNRTSTVGEQNARAGFYKEWRGERDELVTERRSIDEKRSLVELDLAISQALADVTPDKRGRLKSIGELSDGCKKIEADTQQICIRVRDLRTRRAAAQRRDTLGIRIADLERKLEKSAGVAGLADGDPQVRRLSSLTSLSAEQVELYLSLLFASVVELSSGLLLTLGVYGVRLRRMRRSAAAAILVGEPAAEEPTSLEVYDDVQDALAAYVDERIVIDAAAEISATEIFHDAIAWLLSGTGDSMQLTPSRLGRFLQSERALTAEKRGGRKMYRGIRLRVLSDHSGQSKGDE